MSNPKQAPGTIGIHYQIDADLAQAFFRAVESNDRTRYIETILAKALKRKLPPERRRGRPKKPKK